jgi:hypothetical protein
MSMKNSNDTIVNQTRDLPNCTAVTQPSAPPRTTPPPIRGAVSKFAKINQGKAREI